jgi:hypothetical protein
MLECECCLDPAIKSCAVSKRFQMLIGLKGSATGAAIYAL